MPTPTVPTISGPATAPIRKALGLTQAAWAARLGVATTVTISRWENGHGDPMRHFHAKIRAAAHEAGINLP